MKLIIGRFVIYQKFRVKTANYNNMMRTDYKFGIRLVTDSKVLIMLNARNDDDRTKFVEDLREAILEVRLVRFPDLFFHCLQLIARVTEFVTGS